MEEDISKVLLVEGTGDKGVITAILKEWNLSCPLINECGSDVEVFKSLKLYLSNSNLYKTIGVIVDADAHPKGRFQRFVQLAMASGWYDISPKVTLPADGLILNGIDSDAPRIGLWVMPDNCSHGMLEDFLTQMAETTCPNLLDESEYAIAHVEQRGVQQYTPAHRPKAKMHTYLAWQKEPGCTLPQAVMKHYLNASSDNARPFVDWVKRLFWL